MGLYQCNADFTHGGVQVRKGDVIEDDHELYVLFPSRFTAVSGGSGASGAVRLVTLDVTHATSGLAAGVTIFTPAVGDRIIDGWIEVDTAWDGTTPKAIICDAGGGDYVTYVPRDLTLADYSGDGNLQAGNGSAAQPNGQETGSQQSTYDAGSGTYRTVPAKVLTAAPIVLAVSQNGYPGGDPTGSTVGAATACILVVTPA